MGFLVLEEFKFLLALLVFDFFALRVTFLNGLDLGLQLDDLVLLLGLAGLQIGNTFLEVGLTVLSLELFAHGEGNRALVKSLIRGNSHLDLVTHTEEEDTALGLTEGHLTDDLIEALAEQFLAHGADAALTGLTLHELLVERLTEARDVHTGGFLVADVLDEVLAILNPLARREDSIYNFLLLWLRFHGRELALLLASERLFEGVIRVHATSDLNGVFIEN